MATTVLSPTPFVSTTDTSSGPVVKGLFSAIERGSLERVQELVAQRPEGCHGLLDEGDRGLWPQHAAAMLGKVSILQWLVEVGGANVNQRARPARGRCQQHCAGTALHFAVEANQVHTVAYLMSLREKNTDEPDAADQHSAAVGGKAVVPVRTDVLAVDGRNWTPLHAAVHGFRRGSDLVLLRMLLQHGGDAALGAQGLRGSTPMHLALMHHHMDVFDLFLQHAVGTGAVNKANADGTVLHMYLRRSNPVALDVVKRLVGSAGASLSASSPLGTPLCTAASVGAAPVVQWFLDEARVPATQVDVATGRTPLHFAAENARLQVARLLLQHGARIDAKDNQGTTPFCEAVASGCFELAVELWNSVGTDDAEQRHVAAVTPHGKAPQYLPLHFVAKGDPYVFDFWGWGYDEDDPNEQDATLRERLTLLANALVHEANADVDATGTNGRTAVFVAVERDRLQMLQWLLDQGKASTEIPDSHGDFPLHVACRK